MWVVRLETGVLRMEHSTDLKKLEAPGVAATFCEGDHVVVVDSASTCAIFAISVVRSRARLRTFRFLAEILIGFSEATPERSGGMHRWVAVP